MKKRNIFISLCVCFGLIFYPVYSKPDISSVKLNLSAIIKNVQNLGLNLLIEPSPDLKEAAIEATFKFKVKNLDKTPIFFFFPGTDKADEFDFIILNNKKLSSQDIIAGKHPEYGSRIFILQPHLFEKTAEEMLLKVRGHLKNEKNDYMVYFGTWHPYLISYDLKVPISAEIHTTPERDIICSAQLVDEKIENNQKISRWNSLVPLSWMLLTIGNYNQKTIKEESITFTIYWPREHNEFDPLEVSKYPFKIIKFYQKLFGPPNVKDYWFIELPEKYLFNLAVNGFVAITLGSYDVIKRDKLYLEAIMSHEMAHFWWGDTINIPGEGARWFTEAFAEYSRYLFEKANNFSPASWESRNLIMLSWFVDYNPPLLWGDYNYGKEDIIFYQKGPFVLYMLENTLGKEIFEKVLRQFVQHYKKRKATMEDFIKTVEQISGSDYHWFFEQWLKRETGPELNLDNIQLEKTKDSYLLSGNIIQNKPVYRLDLPLRIYFDQDKYQDFSVKLNTEKNSFEFKLDKKPIRIAIDPEYKVFKWLPKKMIPMEFTQVHSILEKNPQITIEGSKTYFNNSKQEENFKLWLKKKFKNIQIVEPIKKNVNRILLGKSAEEYRQKNNIFNYSSADASLLKVFVHRNSDFSDLFVLGIEGNPPSNWPDIVPHVWFDYVEFRGNNLKSKHVAVLPIIEKKLVEKR